MDIECLEKVLDLEDFLIDGIEIENENLIIKGHLKNKKQTCPRYSSRLYKIKDSRYQLIKDVQAFGKNVFINLKKQRYVCKNCSKTFYGKNKFLKKYQRNTNRALNNIFKKCSTVLSFTQVVKDLHFPFTTLIRKFDLLQYPKSDLKKFRSLVNR